MDTALSFLVSSSVFSSSLCQRQALSGYNHGTVHETRAPKCNAIAIEATFAEFEKVSAPRKKMMVGPLRQGRLVEGGIVYRQTFVTPSYEVGADKTASMETFLNRFQETALNHVWMSGLLGDGFGATHAMTSKQLIWVVTRMQVEVEKYPTWGDIMEFDTWVAASGKNGMKRDWLARDYITGQILARAASTWVMIHQKTRRLSKMPDEVRAEITPWFIDRCAIKGFLNEKISKLDYGKADYICSDLKPRRNDLDMNQHVNNVKYVRWMLETIPESVQHTDELIHMTLDYRHECGQADTVQSLASLEMENNTLSHASLLNASFSSALNCNLVTSTPPSQKCYTHLLRLQADGTEILRGKTAWRKRNLKSSEKIRRRTDIKVDECVNERVHAYNSSS